MEKHVISLERQNLSQLEVIERFAGAVGPAAFETDVHRLLQLHTVDVDATIQSISRLTHPSRIGMSEAPFQIMRRLCDHLAEREPALLKRPSYRCRHADSTALPLELWLAIVRHAREFFDPAGLDADFLAARLREGLSNEEAFHALIASKRSK